MMPRPRYAISTLSAMCTLPVVLLIQTLMRTYGPASSAAPASENLTPEALGAALQEPGERLTLLAWWAFAGGLALVATALAPRYAQLWTRGRASAILVGLVAVIGGASMVLLASASVWGHDPDGTWTGIGLAGIIVGLLVSVVILGIWTWRRSVAATASIALAVIVVAVVGRGLFQAPGAIGDPFHSAFVAEEIAAVAAGHFPLSDYIPAYTMLLGFPVAPILRTWPGEASFIVIAWLLALQVCCLAIAVLLPVLQGGWRFVAPAMAVALPPTVVSYAGGYAPATSFGAFPVRPFIPLIAILAAYLVLRGSRDISWSRSVALFTVGVLGGLASLNNPDHGLPALLSLLAAALLALSTWRARLLAIGCLAAGALLVFVAYGFIGHLTGHPVDWSKLVAFARVISLLGWGATPMQPFGFHVAFISLFTIAVVSGIVLLVRSPQHITTFAYRQGLLLLLAGGWSLLTVPYFVGRSVTVTGIGNFAFATGFVGAAMLPLLAANVRAIRARTVVWRFPSAMSMVLGLLMIVALAGTLALARQPTLSIAETLRQGTHTSLPLVAPQQQLIAQLRSNETDPTFMLALDQGRVVQLLPAPNLTGLATGVTSMSISSSDEHFRVSPYFADTLCRQGKPKGSDILLTTRETLFRLSDSQACTALLDFKHVHLVGDDYVWVRLL